MQHHLTKNNNNKVPLKQTEAGLGLIYVYSYISHDFFLGNIHFNEHVVQFRHLNVIYFECTVVNVKVMYTLEKSCYNVALGDPKTERNKYSLNSFKMLLN